MFTKEKAKKEEMVDMYRQNINKIDTVMHAFKSGKTTIDQRENYLVLY